MLSEDLYNPCQPKDPRYSTIYVKDPHVYLILDLRPLCALTRVHIHTRAKEKEREERSVMGVVGFIKMVLEGVQIGLA